MDHALHFRLTLCTLGVWSPVWFALVVRSVRARWRCSSCGGRLDPRAAREWQQLCAMISPENRGSE